MVCKLYLREEGGGGGGETKTETISREGDEGASAVQEMFCFLMWVLVTRLCSLCENASSRSFTLCAHFSYERDTPVRKYTKKNKIKTAKMGTQVIKKLLLSCLLFCVTILPYQLSFTVLGD